MERGNAGRDGGGCVNQGVTVLMKVVPPAYTGFGVHALQLPFPVTF